jgi:phosphate-selective porin
VAALLLGAVVASPAHASAATSAGASLSFSGSGSTMRMVTSVKFTATYTGIYNVKYDVFRSLSSSKSNPVKVNSKTVFTRTYSATAGTTYVYRPTSSLCAAGSTTYYYWVRASVTDTATGTVVVRSPVVAAAACTDI